MGRACYVIFMTGYALIYSVVHFLSSPLSVRQMVPETLMMSPVSVNDFRFYDEVER